MMSSTAKVSVLFVRHKVLFRMVMVVLVNSNDIITFR